MIAWSVDVMVARHVGHATQASTRGATDVLETKIALSYVQVTSSTLLRTGCERSALISEHWAVKMPLCTEPLRADGDRDQSGVYRETSYGCTDYCQLWCEVRCHF